MYVCFQVSNQLVNYNVASVGEKRNMARVYKISFRIIVFYKCIRPE